MDYLTEYLLYQQSCLVLWEERLKDSKAFQI